MTNEAYLIHLIDCAVHDTVPQEKPAEVSFEAVLALAKQHEVANMAYLSVQKLQSQPEEAIQNEWQLAYYFGVQRDMRQQLLYEELITALHENKIRTLEAQGTVTKTLYPSPDLRMMSDIDFIIDADNFDKVNELMRSLGYETWSNHAGELNMMANGLEVEFHTEFFTEDIYGKKANYRAAVNQPFSHAVPSEEDPLKWILEDTYFCLYSILHTIKHYEVMGCGIRRILDLYYLKKAYDASADWALIEQTLAQYGFKQSYEKLCALAAYWFEGAKKAENLDAVIDDVLGSGTHGTKEFFIRNEVRAELEQGVRFAKLRRLIAFIFPDQRYLNSMYPELQKRGCSLTKMRLYRIFDKLRRLRLSGAWKYFKIVMNSDRQEGENED